MGGEDDGGGGGGVEGLGGGLEGGGGAGRLDFVGGGLGGRRIAGRWVCLLGTCRNGRDAVSVSTVGLRFPLWSVRPLCAPRSTFAPCGVRLHKWVANTIRRSGQ